MLKKVEIYQNCSRVSLISIFYDCLGREHMEHTFASTKSCLFYNHPEGKWSKITFTDPKDIRNLLHVLNYQCQFLEESRPVILGILNQLPF